MSSPGYSNSILNCTWYVPNLRPLRQLIGKQMSLCMNTDLLSFTYFIKVNLASHHSGSWVLAVSGPGSSSTWSLTTWPTAACQSVLSTMYNARKPSCQMHTITVWIALSVFHSPIIYLFVYLHSCITLSPILLLTNRLRVASFDIWLS